MDAFDLIAFDIDDTLTESKEVIDSEMAGLFCELLSKKRIAVISGASYALFQKQLLHNLTCAQSFPNLFLLPTNGASLYQYQKKWIRIYEDSLSNDEIARIMSAFDTAFKETHFEMPEKIYGALLENRISQVTFSGLGSEAPHNLKEVWDPNHSKRGGLVAALSRLLPDFSVSIGGTTSIDITRKGIDKAYGLRSIMGYLRVLPARVLYIGDAFYKGGNDRSVVNIGVRYISVEAPGITDTKDLIRNILLGRI